MTEKGSKKVEAACANPPTKWAAGDLVARREPKDGSDDEFESMLYRVEFVPLAHDDAANKTDMLTLRWFERSDLGDNPDEDGNGVADFSLAKAAASNFSLTKGEWGGAVDSSFTANTLAWVDPSAVILTAGTLGSKKTCTVQFDLDKYYSTYVRVLNQVPSPGENEVGASSEEESDSGSDDEDEGDEEEKAAAALKAAKVDPTSLNYVLGRIPMFLSTKSELEELVVERGHILVLSASTTPNAPDKESSTTALVGPNGGLKSTTGFPPRGSRRCLSVRSTTPLSQLSTSASLRERIEIINACTALV